jgi:lysophospholipase L1-like esterase
LANDGLHPSGKMYGLWAEKLAEQISSSLGKNKTK